ncbi:UBC-like protein [Schizophyllum commune]
MFQSPSLDLSGLKRSMSRSKGHKPTDSASKEVDTVSPATKTAVALEYASLRHASHCPLGVYVVPSIESLLVWDAVLFVHQGYYSDAVLKFRLTFPRNYPERPPVVQFVTDVFHPLVAQDGIFNLAPRFRPWRPKEHHVFDVLYWVKAAFKKNALDGLEEGDCLNREAYRYHDSTASFAALATQTASLSQSSSALYDRDHPSMSGASRGGITFREMKPSQIQDAREKLGLRDWAAESQDKPAEGQPTSH